MIDEFIENFRHKHGFNCQTAMLPYDDEGDSDDEPIELEGGRRMVIRRRIISPDEDTMQEEDPDKLEDLVPRPKETLSTQGLMGERVNPWDRRPGRNPRRQSRGRHQNPRKTPKPWKPKKGKKSTRTAKLGEPSEMPRTIDPGQIP